MKKTIKNIVITLFSCSLCACNGFFDKDNTPTPTPLINFTTAATPHLVWKTNATNGVGSDYLKLLPAVTTQYVFTASKEGIVAATDKTNGKTRWEMNVHAEINAGPTAADDLVLIGTREGTIIALREQDGSLAWQSNTASEVLAAPAASHGIVLAKAIDGTLSAFSEQNGRALWHYQQTEPTLILRGASTPKIYQNTAVVGFSNGNLAKLTLQEGNLIWQQTIATPEGAFTIQRMVDIDADPIIVGNRIYAATYQGRIAALDLATGREFWTHDISSYSGIAADNERVYISDAKGLIWAFDTANGTVDWRQMYLKARNITGPAIMRNYMVV